MANAVLAFCRVSIPLLLDRAALQDCRPDVRDTDGI
jgi:hypothetical protein